MNTFRIILSIGAMAWILLLGGCGSSSQQAKNEPKPVKVVETVKVIKPKPVKLTLDQQLIKAVRFNTDDGAIKRLVKQGADINAIDEETGYSVFHYVLSGRDKAMMEWALKQGAKGNIKNVKNGFTPKRMMLAFQQVAIPAKVSNQKNGFSLIADHSANNSHGTKGTVSEAVANKEIAKLQLLNAYVWQQREISKQRKATLTQPIATVAQPQLPPVTKHKKSPFETVTMFRDRMKKAREQRKQQTDAIFSAYRKKVEQRNVKVAEKRAFYQQLHRAQQQKQQVFYTQALAEVYGTPLLSAIEVNGQPKYTPALSRMYAKLQFSRVAIQQEVVMKVPPGSIAETFYNQLKAGQLSATVNYQKDKRSKQFILKNISTHAQIDGQGKTYLAQLSQQNKFTPPKTITAVIKSKEAKVDLAQGGVELVKFADLTNEDFQLQNPNIKDVQFEEFLIAQQKDFNDDIPQLLKKVPQAPIDRTRWLFVIGAGKYQNTDDILYSKRSAEWFAKVASKTLGIQKGRQVVLLDQQATSGAIKDQLKLMLSKVRKGDSVYFYYSGHGVPIPKQSNAPYMLPTDKIADFIDEDNFYKVENIYKQLKNSKARQVFIFMDSCFTGQTDGKSVFQGTKAATRLAPKKLRIPKNGKLAVLTAGTDKQYSNAYSEKGHRLFSYHVIRSLIQGYTKVGDFANRVKVDVTETSLDLGGQNRQTPVFQGNPKLVLKQ